jgi:hypothetical protein
MRTLVAAAVTIAALSALTIPADAQSQRPKFGGTTDSHPTDDGQAVVDEKKYKAAVDRIGGAQQKYDPWANMREKPPAK